MSGYLALLTERKRREQDFIDRFRASFPTSLDDAQLVKLAQGAQNAYTGTPAYDYEGELEKVAKRLRLPDRNTAVNAHTRLMMFINNTNEYSVTVVLTCSLLEVLMQDLLVDTLIISGVRPSEARDAIEAIHSLERLKDTFKELTHQSFFHALKQLGQKDFHARWLQLSEKRNDFLHAGRRTVKPADAKTAFLTAIACPFVFARVHNQVVAVTPPPPAQVERPQNIFADANPPTEPSDDGIPPP